MKQKNAFLTFALILALIFVSSCVKQAQPKEAEIANPASVYCQEQGGTLDIRTSPDGSQTGYCIKNGKECEEWAFYRGECSFEEAQEMQEKP